MADVGERSVKRRVRRVDGSIVKYDGYDAFHHASANWLQTRP
jgi:hypothetical protein